jgi:hypothetical protein
MQGPLKSETQFIVTSGLLEPSGHRWNLHRWPADRAMASVRSKVRQLTRHNTSGQNLSFVVGVLAAPRAQRVS